ncbi:conserved hypothetical protein [Candidatus Accumulibacter aalborgensis]|uniref:Prevent-host-death family protein n=1 Tax=Candidatus Accumulibacter aalborgensis TaxID=1860102 RepID=A0A1A8XQ88_9PROT|nr:UPF0175 family protein [Candidatus Accumulibacter aalborgensis]SBT07305.1 conserved hypothetical protein [Candidatus Accumulibacter aalborgensis]
MHTFSIRDLRERSDDLIRNAEAGHLSLVAEQGHPVFVAVPFDDTTLSKGVTASLAVKLFEENVLSLGRAAQFAGMSTETFMDVLGALGIAVIDYPAADLADEVAGFSK